MAKKATSNKTELTILDRIIIPGILRKEGSYEALIALKDLKKKVSLTQDELKKYGIKTNTETGTISWNELGSKARFDYEFTELETLELKLALTKLHKDEKLIDDLLPLYEKFAK